MDTLTQDRWTEIQFYYICTDLLALRNNMMDVMDVIDNLSIFGNYSPEQIKPIAQEMIASLRYRPMRQELCVLCSMFKVPISEVKRRLVIHNRTYYDILAANEADPQMFYPRSRPEQLKLIAQFVETFNKFRKVGL